LGAGIPSGVSPDGQWVACLIRKPGRAFDVRVVPTGPGEPVTLPRGGVQPFQAAFFPDGKRLLVSGTEPGGSRRTFVQDLVSGLPRPLLPEGWWGVTLTPDGRSIVAWPPAGDRVQLFPLEGGGDPRQLPGLGPNEDVLSFTTDGRAAFVTEGCRYWPPCRIVRLDLQTGRRTPWLDLNPPEVTGFSHYLRPVAVHPSGQFYAYAYERMLSSLYLIEGLK
jgi:Tol biopolymer transport system component